MISLDCSECGNNANYKCPTCRQPYCSVQCCKKHKETPCTAPPVTNNHAENIKTHPEYEYPTEDTVPVDRLKQLESSSSLKTCLKNPHLRRILEEIDQSPQPDHLMQQYMQEPIFTEFVDECLKIVQPEE